MDILSDVLIKGGLQVEREIKAVNGISIGKDSYDYGGIGYSGGMLSIRSIQGFNAVFTEFIYRDVSTYKTFNVFCQKVITIPSGCSKFNIGETYHDYPVVTAYDTGTGYKVELDLYFCKLTKTLQASMINTSTACKQYIFSYMN